MRIVNIFLFCSHIVPCEGHFCSSNCTLSGDFAQFPNTAKIKKKVPFIEGLLFLVLLIFQIFIQYMYTHTHIYTLTCHFNRYTFLALCQNSFCFYNCFSSQYGFGDGPGALFQNLDPCCYYGTLQFFQIFLLNIQNLNLIFPAHPKGAVWD